MKTFLRKIISIALCFFVIAEVFSRIFIDPVYFHYINIYNEFKDNSLRSIYVDNTTAQADFVFIGSSRIPATINPILFSELSKGITINAGRGYTTPGIHYQAIKNKLKYYPEFLHNAVVLLEYPGPDIYTSSFEEDILRVYEPVIETDKSRPHLLLPYLDLSSFLSFLTKSRNGISVKVKMTALMFSTLRACQFINHKFNALNTPLFKVDNNSKLVSEGGIRNDNIEFVRQSALNVAEQRRDEIKNKAPLSNEIMQNSSFFKLYEIVRDNGGTFMVYKMPLHSIQKDIYSSAKSQDNKLVFETWLKEKDIPIIYNSDFKFTDDDFPDFWHLAKDRRDEFTRTIYDEIEKVLVRREGCK